MTQPTKSSLIASLRHQIASAISDAKAYEVPDLCVSVGLESGTEGEAFSSKYAYAKKRLALLRPEQLIETARSLLELQTHFSLSETLSKIEDFESANVTELTRKRIVDVFEGGYLTTEMEPIDFLRRLWPISELRRSDTRDDNRSLEEALFQHTIRNDDWTSGDILKAAGVPELSRAEFFRFLREAVSPLVQSPERQAQLVTAINEHLRHDGYSLLEAGRISGSPHYHVKPLATGSPADSAISAVLAEFSPDDVHARWASALERRANDPSGAITLARTLLEDVCKWILSDSGETSWKDSDDLPVLYRKLSKVLKLAPDDHAEEIFKAILGNCQSIVASLGALRNKLGDAHSPGPKRARPLPRHAELAVNLSGTMATFLVSTWRARQQDPAK